MPLLAEATAARVELEDSSVRDLAVAGLEVLLPADLPLGFHRLVVTADGGETAATLLVAAGPAAGASTRRRGAGPPSSTSCARRTPGASATSRTCGC